MFRSRSGTKNAILWKVFTCTWQPSCPTQRTPRKFLLARPSLTSRSPWRVWRINCWEGSSASRKMYAVALILLSYLISPKMLVWTNIFYTQQVFPNYFVKSKFLARSFGGIFYYVFTFIDQELESERIRLLEDINANNKKMKDLEDNLLLRLTSTQGSLVDDDDLVNVLNITKHTAKVSGESHHHHVPCRMTLAIVVHWSSTVLSLVFPSSSTPEKCPPHHQLTLSM